MACIEVLYVPNFNGHYLKQFQRPYPQKIVLTVSNEESKALFKLLDSIHTEEYLSNIEEDYVLQIKYLLETALANRGEKGRK